MDCLQDDKNQNIEKISIGFGLSNSTIKIILKEYKSKAYNERLDQSKHRSKLIKSKPIRNTIKSFINETTDPYLIQNLI